MSSPVQDPLMSLFLITAPPEPRCGQQHYEVQRKFPAGCEPTVMWADWGDIGDDDRARWEENARRWNVEAGAVGIGPTDQSTGMALQYHSDGSTTHLHLERPAEPQPGRPMVGIGLAQGEAHDEILTRLDGESRPEYLARLDKVPDGS